LSHSLHTPPAGKVLTGAFLRIRTTTIASSGSGVRHYAIARMGPQPETSVSWRTWGDTSLTSLSETDMAAWSLGSVPTGTQANTAYQISLQPQQTAAVLAYTGSLNLAIVSAGTDTLWFWSREHAASSYRPQLVLTYS